MAFAEISGPLFNLVVSSTVLLITVLLLDVFLFKQHSQPTAAMSTTTTVSDSSSGKMAKTINSNSKPNIDPYIELLDPLTKKFLDLADLEKYPSSGPDAVWHDVATSSNKDFNCIVQKRVGSSDFYFRIICDFESSPEETFDIIADIDLRASWDEVTESAGTVENVSPKTSVVFMRTKSLWPTASRSALVASFITKLGEQRFLNVTQSIESHPNFNQPPGDVRMLANIAGLMVTAHPSGNPNLSRCVQVVDGDLGGWLPKSIVSMVTTQAFPISMRNVNKLLRKVAEPRRVSKLITDSCAASLASSSQKPNLKVITTSMTTTKENKPASNTDEIHHKPSSVEKFNTIQYFSKFVRRAQPWLVLLIFLALLFGRRSFNKS